MVATAGKWLLLAIIQAISIDGFLIEWLSSNKIISSPFHPFFVSVTEFNDDQKEKIMEVSCKMFADDLENTLKAQYKTNIDITNPKDVKRVEKYIIDYLQKHLQVKINGKPITLQFVGFEKEGESVWSYLQINNMPVVNKLEVMNNLLYELNSTQISIMHATSRGSRKSTRLTYPDTVASFDWQ